MILKTKTEVTITMSGAEANEVARTLYQASQHLKELTPGAAFLLSELQELDPHEKEE